MRLADYVIEFISQKNVDKVFMLSGGGIMYLVDALGHSNVDYICCHHEQAAGIAAQAYAMERNDLGVCLVTTGPGGTNALTALGAAFVDSTPVFFISGQVKRSDFASLRGVRQFGAQENDIVRMAKPVAKYAVTITEVNSIRYELEKAYFLAMNGRRGPVWIDIPLDIQNSEINLSELQGFDVEDYLQNKNSCDADIKNSLCTDKKEVINKCQSFLVELKKSKRPLILVGYGAKASNSYAATRQFAQEYRIPIVTTWRALDILDDNDPLFFGSPGLQARRYSNLITQGADLLLVLGSRLDNMITAFNEEHFAYQAAKYIVDIDEPEIDKLATSSVTKILCNVSDFFNLLNEEISKHSYDVHPQTEKWLAFCNKLKKTYPLSNEKQINSSDFVDLYKLTSEVSKHCTSNDVIVVSSTSRCNTAGHIAFEHKQNQKCISSMGYGSMGFALPSVVGAALAEGKRTIMFEGDGSLQLNIQEFQTIRFHNLEAKMFIFSNIGYAAIATMQDRNFDGFHVGCDAKSGITMPCLEKIASAYSIQYYKIEHDNEIEVVVSKVMSEKGPVICEFIGDIAFDEIPKCISSLDEKGNRVSASLENPFPFLPECKMQNIFTSMSED